MFDNEGVMVAFVLLMSYLENQKVSRLVLN